VIRVCWRESTVRILSCVLCALALGCAGPAPGETEDTPVVSGPEAPLPPDLRTRTEGGDWPGFLGPTGDGVSSEKGILTSWPREGPRLVWEKRLDLGYAMPSISRGRLFQFDRLRNRARLHCWKSETAEPLWTYEYPTDFEDSYGYDNGPRCCPAWTAPAFTFTAPRGCCIASGSAMAGWSGK
jgi:hypothetical protein